MDAPPPTVAIAFSGGLGLAPYHAGVYETFECQGGPLHWVSGSSAGAVTAALVAGSPKSQRLDRLKTFWRFPPSVRTEASPWRHVYGWMAAIETRLVGSGGFF
jgi:NTE family protein